MPYNKRGDKMIKRLKQTLFSILLSIICGSLCGKIVYGIYDKKIDKDLENEKIYLVQSGAYSSYDSMIKNVLMNNYVYFEDDDGLYKSIIAITQDLSNIDKIKNTYKDNVIVVEYYSNDLELNEKIKEYDIKLKNTSDKNEIKNIILNVLKLYKDKNAKLIQIKS